MLQKKPNLELILRYIQKDVSHQEELYVKQMLASHPDWMETYNCHKLLADAVSQMPSYEPPARVWAKIKSEIRHTHQKPLWQIRFVEFFQPYRLAWASACTVLIAGAWYSQVLLQPEFHIVEVSDVNGFSSEAFTYIANHEVIYNDPVTQDTLLAFYPAEINSSYDED